MASEESFSMTACGHLYHTECCASAAAVSTASFKCPACWSRKTMPLRRVFLHSAINASILVDQSSSPSTSRRDNEKSAKLKSLRELNVQLLQQRSALKTQARLYASELDTLIRKNSEDNNHIQQLERSSAMLSQKLELSRQFVQAKQRTAAVDRETRWIVQSASTADEVAKLMRNGTNCRLLEDTVLCLKKDLRHVCTDLDRIEKNTVAAKCTDADTVHYNEFTLKAKARKCAERLKDCEERRASLLKQRTMIPTPPSTPKRTAMMTTDNNMASPFSVRHQQHGNRLMPVLSRSGAGTPPSAKESPAASVAGGCCHKKTAHKRHTTGAYF